MTIPPSCGKLLICYPQTKTHFSQFDLSFGSQDRQVHEGKVLGAIGEATKHLDNLDSALYKLSDLHAYNLAMNPQTFRLLTHIVQVTLAANFLDEFDAKTQAAWDKFLAAISTVLTSK